MSYYIGDWVDNKKCGRGFRQYPSGSTYEGDWFENVRHGQGTMRWAGTGECYTGQWNMGIQVSVAPVRIRSCFYFSSIRCLIFYPYFITPRNRTIVVNYISEILMPFVLSIYRSCLVYTYLVSTFFSS